MKTRNLNPTVAEGERSFSWIDLVVLLGLFGLLWSVLHFGRGMIVQFDEKNIPPLSMDPKWIPYYAVLRTVLRMWIAFAFSHALHDGGGLCCGKEPHPCGRYDSIGFLDVLQSVPVLGFLSITVTGFIALFPHSLMGVECASIFAIFTGQVWNMTFGFYHSLAITIPDGYAGGGVHLQAEPLAAIYSRWRRRRRCTTWIWNLDDVLWRRLVFRGAKRGDHGDEQKHQAARNRLVHGHSPGEWRPPRLDAGDCRDGHRGGCKRPTRLATGDGMGG